MFNSAYDSSFGTTELSRLASTNYTHERGYKYNVGVDATLFKGLNLSVDAYYQRRIISGFLLKVNTRLY